MTEKTDLNESVYFHLLFHCHYFPYLVLVFSFKVYVLDITILGLFMFRCPVRTMAQLVFQYEFSFSYFFLLQSWLFPPNEGACPRITGFYIL